MKKAISHRFLISQIFTLYILHNTKLNHLVLTELSSVRLQQFQHVCFARPRMQRGEGVGPG